MRRDSRLKAALHYLRGGASMALKPSLAPRGHNSRSMTEQKYRVCITKDEADAVLPLNTIWQRESHLRCEVCTGRLPKGRSVICSERCRKVRNKMYTKRHEERKRILVLAMTKLLSEQGISLDQFVRDHDAS